MAPSYMTRLARALRAIGASRLREAEADRQRLAVDRDALLFSYDDVLAHRTDPIGLRGHEREPPGDLLAAPLVDVARAIAGDARELHRGVRRGDDLLPVDAHEAIDPSLG